MRRLKRLIYPLCVALILTGAWKLAAIDRSTDRETERYRHLAGLAREARLAAAGEDKANVASGIFGESGEGAVSGGSKESGDDVAAGEGAPGQSPLSGSWLSGLREENPDLAGWIAIPGTVIDYPVMQREQDDDFYLDHDFYGAPDPHGTPFLDADCRPGESDNLIIYGHHMKDGTMFQNLMRYQEAEFCETNGYIQFDTLRESGSYQVVLVMILSEKEAEDFPYYRCIDLTDEDSFRGFFRQCARYALWESDELPETGDRLLTLSTCEYSKEDGRLVVIARKTGAGTAAMGRREE